ncbi:MAG: lytic transglycosylase domain-containing protein [Phenylobacterium sp.]|uniref:lytic transglycosylase domain-containing protein n=1 Tax=Phenylobacterium sp. TaxID=1871053 RepID=UPI002734D057|nr:lytic transglycosylase domain-containing protein [Phenylobacterium sp.]MDP3749265.1 lytic transglycosylase domain-containing protein [Phenylobacterium sp.]
MLEIVDGVAIVHDGPAVHTAEGVKPIPTGTATAAITRAPKDPGAITAEIGRAAQVRGLPAALVTAVAWQESRFRPESVSPKGAVGVMQLTQAAADEIGVDRFDTRQNIEGGAAYLRRQLDAFGGDLTLALAAYNAGPGAVQRYRGVPPFSETRNYVKAVLADYARRAARDASGADE